MTAVLIKTIEIGILLLFLCTYNVFRLGPYYLNNWFFLIFTLILICFLFIDCNSFQALEYLRLLISFNSIIFLLLLYNFFLSLQEFIVIINTKPFINYVEIRGFDPFPLASSKFFIFYNFKAKFVLALIHSYFKFILYALIIKLIQHKVK